MDFSSVANADEEWQEEKAILLALEFAADAVERDPPERNVAVHDRMMAELNEFRNRQRAKS